MIYWDEEKRPEKKEINKENIVQVLEYIKNGYLPDWNYKKHTVYGDDGDVHGKMQLPDMYYPLHRAMNIAIAAVNAMDDGFFGDLERKETDWGIGHGLSQDSAAKAYILSLMDGDAGQKTGP